MADEQKSAPLSHASSRAVRRQAAAFTNVRYSTSRTVSFGLLSEDEMNIIFGYYYE